MVDETDNELDADASSVASWLNPLPPFLDPIMISSTTFKTLASTPSIAAATSRKTSTNSQTAISATSCGTTTTVGGSSTSTYCTCKGGFAVDLSTETNTAHTTFMICGADPALTTSTIIATRISTKTTGTKTTTTQAASTPDRLDTRLRPTIIMQQLCKQAGATGWGVAVCYAASATPVSGPEANHTPSRDITLRPDRIEILAPDPCIHGSSGSSGSSGSAADCCSYTIC